MLCIYFSFIYYFFFLNYYFFGLIYFVVVVFIIFIFLNIFLRSFELKRTWKITDTDEPSLWKDFFIIILTNSNYNLTTPTVVDQLVAGWFVCHAHNIERVWANKRTARTKIHSVVCQLNARHLCILLYSLYLCVSLVAYLNLLDTTCLGSTKSKCKREQNVMSLRYNSHRIS